MEEPEQTPVAHRVDEAPLPASRAILFFVLSILWIFPSVGACWIIGLGLSRWKEIENVAFSSVRLEEGLAFLLLLLHAIFIYLALRFRRRERRRLTSGDSPGI